MQRALLERLLIAYARRFPIQKGKLRVVDALWRFVVHNAESQRMAELIYGGFKLPCDLNGMLQRQYYFFGTYFLEHEFLRCWQAAAMQASVISM